MPRVWEVARDLGVTSKEVLARLQALGHPVTSHSSAIDADLARQLRDVIVEPNGAPADPVAGRPAAGGPLSGDPAETAAPQAPARPLATRLLRQLVELPALVLLSFLIAVLVKTFLVQAFYIPSISMLPTLHVGDRVLVEKLTYRFGDPGIGDVVVFERSVFGAPPDVPWTQDVRDWVRELLGLPTGRAEDYIKRVVAVEGDVVRYAGTPRRLFVNGSRVTEPYLPRADRTSPTLTGQDCRHLGMDRAGRGCRVPAGKVFVFGDNRNDSEDSRILGPVDESKIVGRAFVIVWPPRSFGGL